MISETFDKIHTESKNVCMLTRTSQICLPGHFFSPLFNTPRCDEVPADVIYLPQSPCTLFVWQVIY